MEDAQIIELYWARDEEAIAQTKTKYGAWCRGIAIRILELREEAEECESDTYLHAWNSIPPQRPSIFRAWLGRITRNLALTQYRKNHAQRRGGGQTALALEELRECVSSGSDVETQQERREIAEAINRFLGDLSQRDRAVFLRRYWHMTSVREIARTYGMTEGQVSSILFRSRKKLRAQLEKEGIAI